MNNFRNILLVFLLCIPVLLGAQTGQVLITGKVSAELTGEELIGAQVVELDRTGRFISSTATDFSGNFNLQIRNTNNQLKISYLGFKPLVVNIGDRRSFDVRLQDDNTIEEVVVQGRRVHSDGTLSIPQREISGAIQRISTEEFEGLSVSSIDDALQGRIAGLDIVSASGDVGSGSSMRIRGITSINSNSEPLIVLNDVPYESNLDSSFDYANANQEQFANLLNINPDDIDEIIVLKDGASAAIWGSRGANGVILIRTKKGRVGPTRVQYSYRFSGAKQPRGMKMLNGDDYTMLMKQAYFNPYQNESALDDLPELNYNPTFSEYQNFNKNTDWVKEVTQYGYTHDHFINVSGGGDKATFRTSLGYYTKSGTVIEQNLERITTRMSLEYNVSDRIKFMSEFSFTHSDQDNNYDNLLDIAYKKMPNVAIFRHNADGTATRDYYSILQSSNLDAEQKDLMNPVALANLAFSKTKEIRIIPTLRLQYNFLDPRSLSSRFYFDGYVSFDLENKKESKYLPKEVSGKSWDNENSNYGFSNEREGMTLRMDHKLVYTSEIGDDHTLQLYGSYQMESGDSRSLNIGKYGLPSNNITNPTTPGFDRNFGNEKGEWRSMAFTGRFHYTYMKKYVLDASIRRDGSTRFGPNNRWGYFPGVSAKWIISDEKFMEPTQSWLSEFAIRPGWGITGNQPDKEYLYFSRYSSNWDNGNNYIDISTNRPSSIKLSDLKWEKVISYNLGADLHLFDFKYSMDFNVYLRRTEDLLFPDQRIPSHTGFGQISYVNGGTIENKGWEINMNTNKLIKWNDWILDLHLNLSNNLNKIIKLEPTVLNSINTEFDYKNSSYLSRIQEGNSIGSIYGFRYKGVYQYDEYIEGVQDNAPVARDANGNVIKDGTGEPVPMYFAYGMNESYKFRGGDAIYEDVNNDGTIDELDIVYLGNSNPKVNGGFGATLRYKRFYVNAFFNFRYGNKIVNRARMNAEQMYNNDNQSRAVNWRWRKDGDITDIPRALYKHGYNSLGSDRFVEDGSFLRFKYLTFSYAFDNKLLRPVGLNQLNLHLTLNNLYTWTKYSGVDPEVAPDLRSWGVAYDDNKTPREQYFTLSVTVGF